MSDEQLSAVLSEFARTMITDFPIQRILDHLVQRIVELLPISSAGVTLISEGLAPRYIAASDGAALRYERLQTEIGEGPCLAAYETGEAVSVPDLTADTRFPRFAPAAVEAGLAAVFTFPVRHGDGRLGALDLYRDTVGAFDPADMATAQTLADVVAAYLINAQARDAARRTSEGFHYDALHDPLTGLANRPLLLERLAHASHRAARSRSFTAVLFIDVDRFKDVNDTHGHHIGDELLVEIGHRLSALVRAGDTLARFSGDEFVFLGEDLHSPTDGEALAARAQSTFDRPFHFGDTRLTVSASVGLACAGPSDDVGTELLVRADLAMYVIKRSKALPDRTLASYDGDSARATDVDGIAETLQDIVDDPTGASDDAELEAELRAALDVGALEVVYQPIVNLRDGRIVGVESLMRWHNRTRGPISPTRLVAIAERSDLIDEIGKWVLQHACEDHRRWVGARPGLALDLAVNVSARQIADPNVVETFAHILASTGMDPAQLVVELTETFFMEDTDRTIATLEDLAGLGLRLALDDFGSGYSSLRYLDRLPLDVLKIDQHFISRLAIAESSTALVGGITKIAHDLGLDVIAEGVETAVQHQHVVDIGCDSAQGYFYARPMSAAMIDHYLDHPVRGRAPAADRRIDH